MTTPTAPAWRARPTFEKNVQSPREMRAIAPASGLPVSGVVKPLGSFAAPQSLRSTGWPCAVVSVPMSTSV